MYDETHSRAYNQYAGMLNWKEYGIKSDIKFKAVIPSNLETENDVKNIYMMTKFMRDDELDKINYERQRGCGCGRCHLPNIPRLAYVGNGKYQVVENQADKFRVEQASFVGYKIPNMSEVIQEIEERWEY